MMKYQYENYRYSTCQVLFGFAGYVIASADSVSMLTYAKLALHEHVF